MTAVLTKQVIKPAKIDAQKVVLFEKYKKALFFEFICKNYKLLVCVNFICLKLFVICSRV